MGAQPDLILAGSPSFAVRNGRFITVGAMDDVLFLRGSKTKIVDCRDKYVLPGIIDAHTHLTGVGLDLQCADLIGATSSNDVVSRVWSFAQRSRDEWIYGNGWDQNLWPDRRWPDHHALSVAFPDRPVVLRRVDTHAVWLNAE